jgi:hypothetical protein
MNPGAREGFSLFLSLWPRVPRRGQRAATVLCVAGHDEGRPCWLFLAKSRQPAGVRPELSRGSSGVNTRRVVFGNATMYYDHDMIKVQLYVLEIPPRRTAFVSTECFNPRSSP